MATAIAPAAAPSPLVPSPRAALSAPAAQASAMAGDRLASSSRPLLPTSAAGKAALGLSSLGLTLSAMRLFAADRSPQMAAMILVGLGAPLLLLEGCRALTSAAWLQDLSLPKLGLGLGAGAFAGGYTMYLGLSVGAQLFPSLVHPLLGTLGTLAAPALALGALTLLGSVHLASRLGK